MRAASLVTTNSNSLGKETSEGLVAQLVISHVRLKENPTQRRQARHDELQGQEWLLTRNLEQQQYSKLLFANESGFIVHAGSDGDLLRQHACLAT